MRPDHSAPRAATSVRVAPPASNTKVPWRRLERSHGPNPEALGAEVYTVRLDETLPPLLTVEEVAGKFLRTSRRAVYQMVQRDQIPGVIRVGRRLLFRKDVLVNWLDCQGRQV